MKYMYIYVYIIEIFIFISFVNLLISINEINTKLLSEISEKNRSKADLLNFSKKKKKSWNP